MRFHVDVAYRVQQIRDLTNPNAWSYVDSNINPADEASRGHTPKRLISLCALGATAATEDNCIWNSHFTSLYLGELSRFSSQILVTEYLNTFAVI